MFLQVLSHAALLVRSGNKTLLTDPWLIGSCYWRSWWNYPPVQPDLIAGLVPDAIYITHVHWDHFHGPSLRRFSKNTPILVPLERSTRVKRDLNDMGFHNVVEIRHGKSFHLGEDFKLTSYQFSPWGDSALVVEAEGVSVLDANDAKFMGGPLDQILRAHKRFDFALRSHSSANDRICHYYTDKDESKQEDPMLYAESFYRFMEKVKPKYAVPFASNHCYLHKDVFHLNPIVETPVRVQDYVASVGGFSQTELKVMVSGDSWDSEKGFSMSEHTWFTDREKHIAEYRASNEAKLSATYAQEQRARIRFSEFERYFRRFLDIVPGACKRTLKGKPIVFCAKFGSDADYFKIDVYKNEIAQITPDDLSPDSLVFETTALVMKKAMALNMFSHIGISKRVVYRSRYEDAKYIDRFNALLAAYEYEVLPLNRLFSLRTVKVYLRRWREVLLYAEVALGLVTGKSVHQLETEQLR
jgi:UDP-MurNAc hydroxylase